MSRQTFEEKISVIHIKQQHKIPDFVREYREIGTSYSQYHVAKSILEHKDAIVLQEGLYEDYTPQIYFESKELVEEVKKNFSKGLPDSYKELSELQRQFLREFDGSVILFFLGQITHVFKTQSEEEFKQDSVEHDKLIKQLNELEGTELTSDTLNWLFKVREERALNRAKETAREHGANKVLLVYGADHDIEKRISDLKDPSIVFEKSIDAAPDLVESLENILEGKEEKENSNFEERFEELGLSELIEKGVTTLDKLKGLNEKSPWVFKILGYERFFSSVLRKSISISQLEGLSIGKIDFLVAKSHQGLGEMGFIFAVKKGLEENKKSDPGRLASGEKEVKDFELDLLIEKRLITLRKLKNLSEKSPWIYDALLICDPFFTAILNRSISISQMEKFSSKTIEFLLDQWVKGLEGEQFILAVKKCLGEDEKREPGRFRIFKTSSESGIIQPLLLEEQLNPKASLCSLNLCNVF